MFLFTGTEHTMPWYLMVDWVLFNMKNSMGCLITIGYYGFLTIGT